MPSTMAANIGVWNNPHPLTMTHKNPENTILSTGSGEGMGWSMERENCRSNGEGNLSKESESFTGNSSRSSRLITPTRPAAAATSTTTTRRPVVRSDSQKVIEVRNRIFVGGLTEAINEDDLRQLFGQYGQINEVAIKARGGDQFRGFGFITYNRNSEAADCLRHASGEFHTLRGKKINVQAAFKRVEKINISPALPPAGGWMGAPLTMPPSGFGPMGPPQMPPVTFNPFYLGPPVMANGMWYVGPACQPGGGMPFPFSGMPPYPMMAPPSPAMFPPMLEGDFMGQGSLMGPTGSAESSPEKGDGRLGGFDGAYQPFGTRTLATSPTRTGFGGGGATPWYMTN